MDTFAQFVKDKYKVHMLLDNMPAAQPKIKINEMERYSIGFELGYVSGKTVYLNNHISIAVRYTESDENVDGVQQYRVVGFEVKPSSVDYEEKKPTDVGCVGAPLVISPHGNTTKSITWSYSVTFVPDTTPWATRWERYFAPVDTQIHWFSIVNSILIILFLSGLVAMILIRTLHADLRRYSQQLEAQDDIDEKGWKLVYGDVFRTPKHPMLLSVLSGFGVQVLCTAVLLLIFAVLGLLSPANRGSLLTGLLVLVVLMGATAGYAGTRVYKMFKGTAWKRQTLFNALLIPGIIIAIFFIINLFVWAARSTAAVPFMTLLGLFGMWLGVSVPLVFVGSFLGYKKEAIAHPIGINPIPRMIPSRVWYMHPVVHILMGGILPFGAVFIELFFVLGAIWGQKLHYIFTFFFIVLIILLITCAEIAVVMCYFQLCSEVLCHFIYLFILILILLRIIIGGGVLS
jgi:transmembrane 9 superfamily protein 2/4